MNPPPLRDLGNTGLRVSPLGLGMAALGRPGYMNLGHADDLRHDYAVAAMRDNAFALLDLAWSGGVRYFDTARSYGRGEEFLADWLRARAIAAGAVTVGSKWGYTYTADWQVEAASHEVKEHSLAVLQRQIGESRALLGGYLDLYNIHSATKESGVLDNAPVLAALARLRADGLTIGLTTSGPEQAQTLERALQIRVDGLPLFTVVQSTWNLLEPSAGSALRAARALGVGVIVKEALANGRLTARGETNAVHTAAHRRGCSADTLALAAVLHQPWVDVVLSGAAQTGHLESNLAALHTKLSDADLDALAAAAEPPRTYWQTRAALPWN